jgi:type I restriction enzyme S subunit
MKKIPVKFPPLAEQHRIVAKIEELFSDLDHSIAALETARAQLKTYRQAVLKYAFEGRLTEQWRQQHPPPPVADLLARIQAERANNGKPVKSLPPLTEAELAELPGLPEGWCWVRLVDVTICLDSKRIPVNKKERETRQGNIPYYGANGRVGWIDDYIFDEELVLVVEDETFTGREIPFSYKISGKSWVNNHAHVLKNEDGLDIDYLNYSLMFYPFTPLTTGTTGRKKLTQNALNFAPYALAPEAEQQAIVAEIEARLSVVDKLEETIETSLQQAEALRQSILKQAFAGKLVSQDAADEPAGVLLERIKRQKGQEAL